MKRIGKFWGLVILAAATGLTGCSPKPPTAFTALKNAETARQLTQFIADKEAQARAATNPPPAEMTAFFQAARRGNWPAVSNTFFAMSRLNQSGDPNAPQGKLGKAVVSAFHALRNKLGLPTPPPSYPVGFRGPAWEAAKEVYGVWEGFATGGEPYATAFGRDIIQSIPAGSIYFGGTDPGRFLVTALSKSHAAGDPFFILTQNALADGSYLDYLRGMFGKRIYIPSPEDSQQCFEDYTKDASERAAQNKLKPGEDVQTTAGRVQVSGQVAVMQINALLAKIICDKNPAREFFIEESFPLDWMYPHLEPHGLIFKLNRQPLETLSAEAVQKDHDYWTAYVRPMIGDWLKPETSVAEVAAFATKTFGQHDFSGFKGDPEFITNAYSHKMFSKLRSSIAGLYAWRVDHGTVGSEKERLASEADFAFRQAWALCPYSPEAVFRYVNFLLAQNRSADALLIAQTAADMPAMKGDAGTQMRSLVEQLKQFQRLK